MTETCGFSIPKLKERPKIGLRTASDEFDQNDNFDGTDENDKDRLEFRSKHENQGKIGTIAVGRRIKTMKMMTPIITGSFDIAFKPKMALVFERIFDFGDLLV